MDLITSTSDDEREEEEMRLEREHRWAKTHSRWSLLSCETDPRLSCQEQTFSRPSPMQSSRRSIDLKRPRFLQSWTSSRLTCRPAETPFLLRTGLASSFPMSAETSTRLIVCDIFEYALPLFHCTSFTSCQSIGTSSASKLCTLLRK